jgi:hypothetical protein
MEELKRLVDLLSKARIDKLELFTNEDFSERMSKTSQIFQIIRKSNILTTDELSKILYKKLSKDHGFTKVFSRFQSKLINTLFFVDGKSPIFSERAHAYINCAKRIYTIRILEDKGLFKMLTSLSQKTLTISQKYEFTDLNIHLCRILCRQFSSTIPDERKFNFYQNILKSNVELLLIETNIEQVSLTIEMETNAYKNKSTKRNNIDLLLGQIKKSLELIDTYPSIEIISYSSKISAYYHRKTGQIDFAKKYNNKLLSILLSKKVSSPITLENIIINQLLLTLISNDIEEARTIFESHISKINIGHFNWYAIHFYFILNLFHNKFYQEGSVIFKRVVSNQTYRKQPPIIAEIFLVLEAYIQYLERLGYGTELDIATDFRINKFLNQVPGYSQDKQGTNIPIILVQILFFLADKKYSKIIDRIESLNLYSYRHLKKDENFRSQCFIRMISEMVRADFRKQGTIFRTEKLLTKLKAVPIDMYPATAETEIIPYEDLWEMVVERLD